MVSHDDCLNTGLACNDLSCACEDGSPQTGAPIDCGLEFLFVDWRTRRDVQRLAINLAWTNERNALKYLHRHHPPLP